MIGDLFEIKVGRDLVYAQFIREDPMRIRVLRIFDGSMRNRPQDLRSVTTLPTRFLAFVMTTESPYFDLVGNFAVADADQPLPVVALAPHSPGRGKPDVWRLWDGLRVWEAPSRIHNGRELQKAQLLSPRYLISALKSGVRARDAGWVMTMPGEDEAWRGPNSASTAVDPSTASGRPVLGGKVRHFIAVRTREQGDALARHVPDAATAVYQRGDDGEWVVEITHYALGADDIDVRGREYEELAKSSDGDYEGWESEVQMPRRGSLSD